MAKAPSRTEEPIDPDVDLHAPAQRTPLWRGQLPVVAAVAAGGGLGAAARYAAALAWPTAGGAFPWTTLLVNAAGCAVIGVFMVVSTEVWAAHPLVRPFFGTGVLGGFTTFSAYAVDIQRLADQGAAEAALGYLALTLVIALVSVWATASVTRRVVRRVARHQEAR
ncbi:MULTISPECIES: CrcB family protein [unclassified Streptomyces]|uniref:fluoride efflux transporter FluC n=1 Tax=unclassified Streptomyces TaxID=2593676 RepID=UPI002DD9CB1C|nr:MULTISPECIES: CrcB family protein [unclassified Streptomyces]WSA91298.1 CrcB family protein [Streptomyces sp. NBC_01795]WSB75622.1 CrcB family protein [Streptomyces sp. NBC_01775]WSS44912.1 CrcB family protein [Streptomyces sp. NBC_01187]